MIILTSTSFSVNGYAPLRIRMRRMQTDRQSPAGDAVPPLWLPPEPQTRPRGFAQQPCFSQPGGQFLRPEGKVNLAAGNPLFLTDRHASDHDRAQMRGEAKRGMGLVLQASKRLQGCANRDFDSLAVMPVGEESVAQELV